MTGRPTPTAAFHGTVSAIAAGDTIVPWNRRPVPLRNWDMSKRDTVYLTDDIAEAYWWAALAAAAAPLPVEPRVIRAHGIVNARWASACGVAELLADSAVAGADVTAEARSAWFAKDPGRFDDVVAMGGLVDSPRVRALFTAGVDKVAAA
jgi:hypothetical protein